MSSFNNVNKVTYSDNQDAIVSLLEYILFENTKESKKYIVFKFNNNLNQSLKAIRFEISEYDADGDLIEKSILDYDKFNAKPGASFVPNAKLSVDYNCKTIKAKLIYAKFERVSWNEGKYEAVAYTLDEFRKDFSKEEAKTKKQEEKERKSKIKLETKKYKQNIKLEKSLKKKRHFISKEFINSNRTKAPKVITILLIISFIIYIGVSIFYFNKFNLQFYENGFQYEVSSEGATIVDYDGNSSEVIIPAKAMDYDVVAVGKKAFDGEGIESITFQNRIAVMDMAFKNCRELRSIYGSDNISRVGDYAFENCRSLRELDLSNATYIGRGAFQGCDNLTVIDAKNAKAVNSSFVNCDNIAELSIGHAEDGASAKDIFGSTVPISLKSLSIAQTYFDKGFFSDMGNVNVTMTNEAEAEFEYGALKGLNLISDYQFTDYYEIYKGHIVSINKESERFVIPAGLTSLQEDLERFDLGLVTRLSIEDQNEPVGKELMSLFYNLRELEYHSYNDFYENAFDDNFSLSTLILNSNESYLNGVDVRLDKLSNLIIEGDGYINNAMLANGSLSLSRITDLKITGEPKIEANSLAGMVNLYSATMPNLGYSMTHIGLSSYVNTLNITDSRNLNLASNFIDGMNHLQILNLPSNVKTIGNGFISNCPSLYELNIPSSVEYIGDRLISNCGNISSLALPEGLKSIGANIISNTSIQSIAIPDGVKSIKAPILEADSYVSYVKVPFISAMSYKEFNHDYINTFSLTITNDVNLANGMLMDLPNLSELKILGKAKNPTKGALIGCTNLRNLELDIDLSFALTELFGVDKLALNNLIISSDTLKDGFFNNCSFQALAIKHANNLEKDLFRGLAKANRIFIPSVTQKNSINYIRLFNKVNEIYSDGSLGEDAESIINSSSSSLIILESFEEFKNIIYY